MPTKKEIATAEAQIDQAWKNTPLPVTQVDHCLYQVLTYSEDRQRWADKSPDPNAYFAIHDGIKYALRRALLLVHENAQAATGPPYKNDWTAWQASHHFLEAAADYESATLAFALHWVGEAECTSEGDTLAFRPLKSVTRHEALDLIIAEDFELGALETVLTWLEGGKESPAAVRSIARTVELSAPGRVGYTFISKLAAQLGRKLPVGKQFIPDSWQAWDLTSVSVRKILHALRTRCAYHLIAVYRGASKFDIEGGAVDDLLLVLDRTGLIEEIVSISSEDEGAVQSLLDALTYGTGTTTPDPALQPVVALNATQVAIPCHLVLTSSMQRNLLSLQARVRSIEFHRQSKMFEARMIDDVVKILGKGPIAWKASIGSRAGEIDLLLGQQGSNLLALLELKWLIPAGDRDEVLNRRKAVKRGAEQVKTKSAAVLEDLERYKALLGVSAPVNKVVGAVICDGFTHPADEPCVPFSILKKLLRRRLPLAELVGLLQDQPWLPREVVHFEVIESQHTIGRTTFSWVGNSVTAEGAKLGLEWSGK